MEGKHTQLLIDIPETIAIIRNHGTFDSIVTALEIISEFFQGDSKWKCRMLEYQAKTDIEISFAFGAIYEAGRIQGMREIRAGKRNNVKGADVPTVSAGRLDGGNG